MVNDDARTARWSGVDYAKSASHHRAADDWFLERHRPARGDVVVDLGCGSGEFSAQLAAMIPDGQVIGVDSSPSMLDAAGRQVAANLEFVGGTAERLDDVMAPGTVDLVVSRAMLHWLPMESYPRCFDAVFRVLRPGGWFHSESAGAGNVAAVVALVDRTAADYGLPPTPPFPDPGAVFDLVENAGFDIPPEGVRTVVQRRPFTRDELIGLLRSQAAVALTRQSPDRAGEQLAEELAAGVDRLRRSDGSYDQTFVRLEILARRPA